MRKASSPRAQNAVVACQPASVDQVPLGASLSASARRQDTVQPNREGIEFTELQQQIQTLTERVSQEVAGRQDAVEAQALAEQRAEESMREAMCTQRIAEQRAAAQAAEAYGAQAAISRAEQQVAAQSIKLAELQIHNGALECQVAALRAHLRETQSEIEHARRIAMQRMGEQIEALRRQHAADMEELDAKCKLEMAKRKELASEIQELRRQRSMLAGKEAPPPLLLLSEKRGPPDCSEGRLRSTLTRAGASTEELRIAIQAVDALVNEARRELAGRQLRERRAAFEQLHVAMEKRDEEALTEAVAAARRANVDLEDIVRGEAALRELQSLSTEERAARAAQVHLAKSKERAFLLVKRDDVAALGELLAALDGSGTPWRAWKDHARRTLLHCACDLRAAKTREFLESLFNPNSVEKVHREAHAAILHGRPDCSPTLNWTATPQIGQFASDHEPCQREAPGDTRERHGLCPWQSPRATASRTSAPETTPEALSPIARERHVLEDDSELRTKAFRAVVKDDTEALAEVTSKVPVLVWKGWSNKGGKDLLTLSEERGSKESYSMLAKALGVLKERKREAFEERETVWVLCARDVQARRGTVLEDTAPEAEEISVEFWDGNEGPTRIPRDSVLKWAG